VSHSIGSVTVVGLDAESREWVSALGRAGGRERDAAQVRLDASLLRIARNEVNRRCPSLGIAGPELDDLAHQAAADATMAITSKLAGVRGESRFATWAVSVRDPRGVSEARGDFWGEHGVSFGAREWDRLPDRFRVHRAHEAEGRDLAAALRTAVENELTERQREAFVAIVLNGAPLDAVVVELGTNRNAIYKMMFDARRKLCAAPSLRVIWASTMRGTSMGDLSALDRFLQTDPRDVGCEQAMAILRV
jgi:RNA polymerase sigma-70 factor (ECF subfamily)